MRRVHLLYKFYIELLVKVWTNYSTASSSKGSVLTQIHPIAVIYRKNFQNTVNIITKHWDDLFYLISLQACNLKRRPSQVFSYKLYDQSTSRYCFCYKNTSFFNKKHFYKQCHAEIAGEIKQKLSITLRLNFWQKLPKI